MGEFALQSSWGVLVALYLFLGGLAGGTALVSGVLRLRHGERYGRVVRFGAWAATALLIVGVLCLLAETTMPLRAMQLWRAFTNPASWMTIGAWLLVAAIVTFGLFALASTPVVSAVLFKGNAQAAGKVQRVLAVLSAVLGCCVALYTGILIGVLVNHPLWNTPLIPVLFAVSAWDTGIALVCLYLALGKPLAPMKTRGSVLDRTGGAGTGAGAPEVAFAVATEAPAVTGGAVTVSCAVGAEATEAADAEASPEAQRELTQIVVFSERCSALLIVAEVLVITVLLAMVSASGAVGGLSVWALVAGPLAPVFWIVLVALGLVAPLALEVLQLRGRGARWMAVVAPALVLVGGLALRFLILYAGLPLSL